MFKIFRAALDYVKNSPKAIVAIVSIAAVTYVLLKWKGVL